MTDDEIHDHTGIGVLIIQSDLDCNDSQPRSDESSSHGFNEIAATRVMPHNA